MKNVAIKYLNKEVKKIITIIEVYIPESFIITYLSLFLIAHIYSLKFGHLYGIEQFIFFKTIMVAFAIITIIIILRLDDNISIIEFLGLKKKLKLMDFLISILLSFVILFLLLNLDIVLKHLFPVSDDKDNLTALFTNIEKSNPIIILLIPILAAVGEEITRVFALKKIQNRFSKTFFIMFIIIHSIHFGLLHLSLTGFTGVIWASIAGVILSVIYIWKKNIYMLFIIHFILDLIPMIPFIFT